MMMLSWMCKIILHNTVNTIECNTDTSLVYRFIPQTTRNYASAHYSGNNTLENSIYNTKDILDEKLPRICTSTIKNDNLTNQQRKIITKLQRTRHSIMIKPADKTLVLSLWIQTNTLNNVYPYCWTVPPTDQLKAIHIKITRRYDHTIQRNT